VVVAMSCHEHHLLERTRHHVALGRAIRELRARRGWSQEGLAFHARLHRNYIGAIERGEINPTLRTLLALERGLRVPLSELMAVMERHVLELPSTGVGC
jgi:transcriptional regulator with XRE-family HTH domain